MGRMTQMLSALLALSGCAPAGPWPAPSNKMGAAEPRPDAPPPPPRVLSGVEVHGCPEEFVERFDPGPATPGPLRLESISCLDFQSSPYTVTDPILSPDGAIAARWHGGSPAPIEISRIEAPGRVDIPNRVTFRSLVSAAGSGSSDALAWSIDSQALWSVRQESMTPSGFALGGLEPITIGRDGNVRALPPLRHRAGPLDGLQWVGSEGRALAVFGTRGRYYRPEHEDREPTLAMVDAARSRVLASIAARNVPELRPRLEPFGLMVAGATAILLPDGRMSAVLRFNGWAERRPGAGPNGQQIIHPPVWLFWTQGEPPRVRPSPYANERISNLMLTPNGNSLLVVRPLQPDGAQIQCRAPPCPQGPPPTPVTGPIAELIDASTGRLIWRLRARASRFWSQSGTAAISGRYVLIPLPPEGDRSPIAVVEMRRGRVMQIIAPAGIGSHRYGLGFTADGRRAWVSTSNMMFFYRIGGR